MSVLLIPQAADFVNVSLFVDFDRTILRTNVLMQQVLDSLDLSEDAKTEGYERFSLKKRPLNTKSGEMLESEFFQQHSVSNEQILASMSSAMKPSLYGDVFDFFRTAQSRGLRVVILTYGYDQAWQETKIRAFLDVLTQTLGFSVPAAILSGENKKAEIVSAADKEVCKGFIDDRVEHFAGISSDIPTIRIVRDDAKYTSPHHTEITSLTEIFDEQ